VNDFNREGGQVLHQAFRQFPIEHRNDPGPELDDLLPEEPGVEAGGEADDFKSLRELTNDVKRVDPDRARGTEDGQTFHGVPLT